MVSRRKLLSSSLILPFSIRGATSLSSDINSFSNLDLGVASGDPRQNSVVIWTRIPQYLTQGSLRSIEVEFQVAKSPDFSKKSVVKKGRIQSSWQRDFTVKTEVDDLEASTIYYYRFIFGEYISVIGRTKTAPLRYNIESLRFAIMSCQDYSSGFYTSYQNLINENLDFCVHLGDYIYEEVTEDNSTIRFDPTGLALSLDQYRLKYRYYLSDPYLREARRLFPFIHIWDDHEFLNNYAGASATQTSFLRAKNAAQAFTEYLPVPELEDNDDAIEVDLTRKLNFGPLLDIYATDSRMHRTSYPCKPGLGFVCSESNDEKHTMLGAKQKNWLKNSLSDTSARWKLILTSTMFAPFKLINQKELIGIASQQLKSLALQTKGFYLNFDAWDGYPQERLELTHFLFSEKIRNVVFCSGDIHSAFTSNIHLDPNNVKSPRVAKEITTSSLSSKNFADHSFGLDLEKLGISQLILKANPHMTFGNFTQHGYTVFELNEQGCSIDRIAVVTIKKAFSTSFVLSRDFIPEYSIS
ncbi:MAG: alkaline phosphatase D family protein [Oligoflexales bacterium]|nr:alkaline phosphatase D family protein [Oligoflexales bacterium]